MGRNLRTKRRKSTHSTSKWWQKGSMKCWIATQMKWTKTWMISGQLNSRTGRICSISRWCGNSSSMIIKTTMEDNRSTRQILDLTHTRFPKKTRESKRETKMDGRTLITKTRNCQSEKQPRIVNRTTWIRSQVRGSYWIIIIPWTTARH